ncbi:MAG: hypothetical protein FWC95_07425 [Defluviitaleaceae bacterium]|nr:hypothetical protein [Defluviitaleaceae bacterium]
MFGIGQFWTAVVLIVAIGCLVPIVNFIVDYFRARLDYRVKKMQYTENIERMKHGYPLIGGEKIEKPEEKVIDITAQPMLRFGNEN